MVKWVGLSRFRCLALVRHTHSLATTGIDVCPGHAQVPEVNSASTPLYGYFGDATFSMIGVATRCPECNSVGFSGPCPAVDATDLSSRGRRALDAADTSIPVPTTRVWRCLNNDCQLALRKELLRDREDDAWWCSPRSLPDKQFRHAVKYVGRPLQ